MSNTWYVTMTDKFMSGWGKAENKVNKLVFECESLAEARIVEENAHARTDQIYINIRATKPYYNSQRYYVQHKTKSDYNTWYTQGAF